MDLIYNIQCSVCLKRAYFHCCFLHQYCSENCQVQAIQNGHLEYCYRQQDTDKVTKAVVNKNPNYKLNIPTLEEIYPAPQPRDGII